MSVSYTHLDVYKRQIHDCAHCDKTGTLTDRKAKKFPVRCSLGMRTIYNPVPIYMGDKPGCLLYTSAMGRMRYSTPLRACSGT